MNSIIIATLIVAGIGLIAAIGLVVAAKVFAVPVDEREEKITEVLPGANCGSCGYAGCSGYAAALVKGEATPNRCAPGGQAVAQQISAILGVDAGEMEAKKAVVMCRGCEEFNPAKMDYVGVKSCAAAANYHGGPNKCKYGCIGFGDCADSCPFGAISVKNGIAVIDEEVCTGCGACVGACPKAIIQLISTESAVAVKCSSHYGRTEKANVCKAGCKSCKLCEKNCPEACITMVNNLPVIDYSKCTGCGTCTTVCKFQVIKNIVGNK